MKMEDVQACAAETLEYFIEVMSDVLFSKDDIVIEFAPQAQRAFLGCLFLLHEQIRKDRPWRISEDFIAEIGSEYIALKAFNRIDFSNI